MIDGAIILCGFRTPFAAYNTHFRDIGEIELGAIAAREALQRSSVDPSRIDHVVFGNALQTSPNALYGARHVGLKAGLSHTVPALTVNRSCASGMESIITAARLIALNEAGVVLAGGMENMTQAPHVARGLRSGLKMGHARLDDSLVGSLLDSHCGFSMADTAENLALERGISREDADLYALRSQMAAQAAYESGKIQEEIVSVTVRQGDREYRVSEDNHRRADTTMEMLARLPPAFGAKGFVTAGNASGIVDGAAAALVASPRATQNLKLRPLGRLVSHAVVGVPPHIMGIGPVGAIRMALERAGLGIKDIDLFEINEAFSVQYLAVEKELNLDRDRVNVNGGAIALGHPLGATGTRLVLTLLLELRRRGARYGIASACVGGGQGMALVVEAM